MSVQAERELVKAATAARDCALAQFSRFCVGAAVETEGGKVYTGCNIESASYGLTVCAERVAIWKALSEGERKFTRLAVVVDTERLTPPCGACRQVIWEFCGDIETFRMKELLPHPFDAGFLKETGAENEQK